MYVFNTWGERWMWREKISVLFYGFETSERWTFFGAEIVTGLNRRNDTSHEKRDLNVLYQQRS